MSAAAPLQAWFMALPGITAAAPLDEAGLAAWPDSALADRLHHLAFCPVLLSEIYQIAWHYPLVVRDSAEGLLLMADLRHSHQQRPVFDAAGRLLRGYRPAVSKLLPFAVRADGQPLRLTGPGLAPGPARGPELRRQILQLLALQGDSHRRIAAALGQLRDLGGLSPDPGDPGSWRPAAPDLPDHPPEALFLGLRLLAALDFSAMHRQDRPDPDRRARDHLPGLLGRDAALRARNFLDLDRLIDFSGLAAPSAAPDPAAPD